MSAFHEMHAVASRTAWIGCLVAATAAPAAAQESPCVSEPAYTLDGGAPWTVVRDSARAEPIEGGGLVLTEAVTLEDGATLAIVGRSCLGYVVEYALTLEPAPDAPSEALERLAGALSAIAAHNVAPVPLENLVEIVRARGEDLLAGEWIAVSDNEFGETVRVERDAATPGTIRLVYVVGL